MQWYFLSDTQEQVPVQEEHLAGLVQTGVVRPNTMIWKEGMDQWIACSEAKPELFAQRQVVPVVGAAATARQTAALQSQAPRAGATPAGGMQMGDGQLVREAASTFASASIWMKLIGVVLLLAGVLYIISALFLVVTGVSAPGALIPAIIVSLITATIGAIIMWMGMLLFQSAGKAQEAALSGQKQALISALEQNSKFFKICGITLTLIIAIYGLIIVLAASGLMGGALFANLLPSSDMEEMMETDGIYLEGEDMENIDDETSDMGTDDFDEDSEAEN